MLDAGAGSQPYRDLFSHCIYETADFEMVDKPYGETTYVCDLKSIPVESDTYDAIVFTQAIEHLPDPIAVIRELKRVLKPNCRMFCTGPLLFEEHEQPYDFYRYTQFGWRHIMNEAQLEIERLDWLEGYFGTVAYQLLTASRYLPWLPSKTKLGITGWLMAPLLVSCKLIFLVLSAIFSVLDEKSRYTATGFPINYIVIVHKPNC